ncbi:UNVERIFIED_CONTAM: hypothetical protein GTU68_004002 [Idotea baltica]|nr:hypothetical protein [Idotea baltica]
MQLLFGAGMLLSKTVPSARIVLISRVSSARPTKLLKDRDAQYLGVHAITLTIPTASLNGQDKKRLNALSAKMNG